jgi:hypothetical protein
MDNHDQYEISAGFQTPAAGSPKWPLTLQIDSLSIFELRSNSLSPVSSRTFYFSFSTSDGEGMAELGWITSLGWLLLVAVFVMFACSGREKIFEEERFVPTRKLHPDVELVRSMEVGPAPNSTAYQPTYQMACPTMQPYTQPYAQPYAQQGMVMNAMFAQPSAAMQPMPVAQPMGLVQQAMPMAIAQPMQGGLQHTASTGQAGKHE